LAVLALLQGTCLQDRRFFKEAKCCFATHVSANGVSAAGDSEIIQKSLDPAPGHVPASVQAHWQRLHYPGIVEHVFSLVLRVVWCGVVWCGVVATQALRPRQGNEGNRPPRS
jgi:hypothetical protein